MQEYIDEGIAARRKNSTKLQIKVGGIKQAMNLPALLLKASNIQNTPKAFDYRS
jgi:hypothetical protein